LSQQRPNILYIMADDHCANAISIYGSRLASVFQTPHLDRIGKEGVVLNHSFCTNAICTPSRATILTGLYSHKNGVKTLSDPLDPALNTYPQIMQRAGYETAVVGKWHVHCQPQGFDYYDVLPGQGQYVDPYFLDQETDWETVDRRMKNQADWSKVKNLGETGKRFKGHVTDIITDKCLDWLEQRDKNKPFMLMCHHKAPHDDFEYHPRYEHLFDGIEMPEPKSLWEDKSHRSDGSREYGTTVSEKNKRRNAVQTMSKPDYATGALDITGLEPAERTKAAYQKYIKDYLRVVKGIDDNVGRLLDYLDKEGLTENTVIVYTSDQGMFLGEHDYIDKRWIFEEALQMPLLIRYPQEIKPGTRVDDIVTNVDFAPTLLDYAGLAKPVEMQGRSFRPVIIGNASQDWPNLLYYRYWMHMAHHDNPAHYGIRTKDYKLIFFYGLPLDATDALPDLTPPGWELYDLKHDPQELRNVYERPEYADIVTILKKQLFEMKKEVGDEDDSFPELVQRVQETM
jgi:arylsulfatase A-like enzyme